MPTGAPPAAEAERLLPRRTGRPAGRGRGRPGRRGCRSVFAPQSEGSRPWRCLTKPLNAREVHRQQRVEDRSLRVSVVGANVESGSRGPAAGNEEPASAVFIEERADSVEVPRRLDPKRCLDVHDPARVVGVDDPVTATAKLGERSRLPCTGHAGHQYRRSIRQRSHPAILPRRDVARRGRRMPIDERCWPHASSHPGGESAAARAGPMFLEFRSAVKVCVTR